MRCLDKTNTEMLSGGFNNRFINLFIIKCIGYLLIFDCLVVIWTTVPVSWGFYSTLKPKRIRPQKQNII